MFDFVEARTPSSLSWHRALPIVSSSAAHPNVGLDHRIDALPWLVFRFSCPHFVGTGDGPEVAFLPRCKENQMVVPARDLSSLRSVNSGFMKSPSGLRRGAKLRGHTIGGTKCSVLITLAD